MTEDNWIMKQILHDVLFAHWPLPPETVREFVPAALQIDTFKNQAWVSAVALRNSAVRPRALPATPWLSSFTQVNLRTYVTTVDGPGLFFLSLDVPNRAVVLAGRRWYRLPYFHARCSATRVGDGVQVTSRRTHLGAPPAVFSVQYHPTGPDFRARPGSQEHWLMERDRLYSVDRRGRVYGAFALHGPWALQPARVDFEINTLAPEQIRRRPRLYYFSRRMEIRICALRRLGRPDMMESIDA